MVGGGGGGGGGGAGVRRRGDGKCSGVLELKNKNLEERKKKKNSQNMQSVLHFSEQTEHMSFVKNKRM